MSTPRLDAVSLGILWDRLISISNELEQTLARTSFSTILRESWDLAIILFDARGRTLAQGAFSMPTFVGTAPETLKHMLKKFPAETLQEGDVVITNNAWMGTGHNFDVCLMRPAFREGRLIGYVMSISHVPDVGGRGFSALNTQMYEEGLMIPPSKLVRAGVLNDEMIDLIRMNVRVAEQVIGDIMANVTAVEAGCRRLVELLDEYGLPGIEELADAIIGQSEAAMRRQIRAMPDGVHHGRLQLEGLEGPITIACRIEIAGERLTVDFTGSDLQVAAAFNVPFCYTRALAAYAMKLLLLPKVPNNVGSVDPIEISAPPGTVVNALPPVATAARHLVGHNIIPMIFMAMSEALPEAVMANPGFTNILNIQGVNRGGEDFATLFFTAGGHGAMHAMDGNSTTPLPSNMRVLSTEVLENLTGLTIEHRRLRTDSGGPGEWRGGLGQHYRLVNTTGNPLHVIGLGRRNEFPALGLKGGQPGAARIYRLEGKEIFPRGRYTLQPGEAIEVMDAGGGGYGDPRRRNPDAVRADLAAGFISPEAATRDYGVKG